MLVQHEQVVDVKHPAKTQAKKRIQPPKERTVEDTRRGLGSVNPVLGTQMTSLAVRLEQEKDALDHDGRDGDVANHGGDIVGGTEA